MTQTQRRWLERTAWLAAFLLPLTFNPLALTDPFETPKVWLFQLIVFGMMGVALWPRPAKLVKNPLTMPVVVYGLVVVVATAVSIDTRTSLKGDAYPHGTPLILSSLLFFLLLTSALNSRRQIEPLINASLIASVPVALYGLIQFLGFDPIPWAHDSVSPVHSTLGRSLYLGSYLAMIMPFTLLRLIQHCANRQRQIAFAVILLLQTACLLFTLARGAWLGFLGGMVLFVALVLDGRRFRLRGIGLLLIVGAAGLLLISQRGWLVFPNLPGGVDLGPVRLFSANARLTTWRDALALVPHRWLLGYGPETFATAVTQQLGIIPGPYERHLPDPHNLLLYQVTAVGLAGLSAFLWLIGRFYTLMFAKFRQTSAAETRYLLAAILSSTTAYLIQAQFNPDMISLSALFWINLATGITLVRLAVTTNDNN